MTFNFSTFLISFCVLAAIGAIGALFIPSVTSSSMFHLFGDNPSRPLMIILLLSAILAISPNWSEEETDQE